MPILLIVILLVLLAGVPITGEAPAGARHTMGGGLLGLVLLVLLILWLTGNLGGGAHIR